MLMAAPALALAEPRPGSLESPAAAIAAREGDVASSQVTVGSGDHHVLAVHGWFGSARGWGSLPDYLDRSAYTYVFMDLRGYGDRQQASGDFTMAEAAADALALADDLGWDQFSLVGHSMGGKVGQQVLLQAPGRVRRLVGINPVPATEVPFDEQGWALFSGAAGNPGNRAAIIDFTTGSRLTRAFIDQLVQHSLQNSAGRRSAPTCAPGRRPISPSRSRATPPRSRSSSAPRTRRCPPR